MKFKTFLYSGTAGLAACLFVSCGGGDGNLSPLASNNAPPPAPMPVDSQAPTLNFTGSSTDVQGGETVVLSVLANDNVDAQVDVMISCNGGNLQSDFLRTLETDTSFTITCTANASDAAGNATVETIEISVGTTLITPNLGGDSLSLSPGEYGGIDFEGVLNSDDEVSALLAGEDLPIIRQGNSLIFFTPLDASVGTTVLTLTVGQRVFTFDVEIEASPSLVVDARQSLESQIDSLITEIDGLIPDFGENDPLGMELAAVKMQLETTLNDLENITASDLDIIARIVASNIGFGGELDAQSSTLKARSLPNVTSFSGSLFGPTCGSAANAVRDRIRPLFTSIFLSGSGYTLISGASSISGLAPLVGIAGTALGVVAAGIGIVAFARNLRALRGEFIEFTAECSSDIFENFVVSLIDESRGKLNLSAKSDATLSKSSRLIFTEGEAEQVLVMGTPTLFDEVTDVPQQLGRLLASLTDIDVIPDSLTGTLQDLIDIDNEIIDSELLEVSNISRDDISAVFDTGSLTFSTSGEEDNSSNIDFSFDIGQGGGVLTTIQAQLNILPEADDVMIMVTAGETVTGTVQTRGAESVRLTSNPAQGQATLETDGAFSYTANSGAVGQDSFSYEAVNANGVSDPATVFVDIESLVVIARDTSIVLPAGESVTFEVDSENATSWSLSLVDGEIPPVEFFPTVGFFPENPPGFITIETSDDAQGEFNLTYIAQNGEVSDTGVISIFVTAEEEDDLPGPEVSVIFPNPVLPGRTELIGVTGGPSNPEISRFLLDNGGLNTENGLLEIDSFTRLVYTANADAMVGLDTFIVNVELGDGTVEAIRVGVQIAEDPFIGFYDVVATSDSPNPCNNINLQPSDEVGVSYEWSFEIAYSIENQEYTAILPDEWAALQLTNNGQNRTNIIGGTSNPPSNRQIISEPEGLRLRLIESSFNDAKGLDETYELDFQPNSTFSNPLEGRYDITDRDENGAIECIIRYRFVIEERE